MEVLNTADLIENVAPATAAVVAAPESETPKPQEPLQKELARVRARGEGHTRREKLEFTKSRIEQQLSELDSEEGVQPSPKEEDDEAPVTVGMLKKLEAQKSQKTAIQMAEDIQDDAERELVTYHLQNTIKPTGSPAEDIRLARAIVYSAKNAQVAEELARRTPVPTYRGGAGAPANIEVPFEPTGDEVAFMRQPFNMTKEDILKARAKAQR